jgi:hypothetical protein
VFSATKWICIPKKVDGTVSSIDLESMFWAEQIPPQSKGNRTKKKKALNPKTLSFW